MPQKVKNFFVGNWFAILTIIGMAIHSYYSIAGAQENHSREIFSLQVGLSNVLHGGSLPLREIRREVNVLTNDTIALKDFVFKMDRRLNRFERNLDRVTWVVDEIARKNGISVPKQISEPPYE